MDDLFNGMMDLTAVPDTYQVIPKGDYHVAVLSQKMETAHTGNRQLSWEMLILNGDYSGVRLSDNITFTEKALPRIRAVLSRLGDVDMTHRFHLPRVNLVGKQAIVSVGVEPERKSDDGTKTYPPKNKVDFAGYHRPNGFQYLTGQGIPPHMAPDPDLYNQNASPYPAQVMPPQTQYSQPPAPPSSQFAAAPPPPPTAFPVAAPPPPPATPPPQVSPDGKWMFVNGQWVPNTSAPPPPPAPAYVPAPDNGTAPRRPDGMPF